MSERSIESIFGIGETRAASAAAKIPDSKPAAPTTKYGGMIGKNEGLTAEEVRDYLGWTVTGEPMMLADGTPVPGHVCQTRSGVSGKARCLGVVSTKYRTIQNEELIQIAEKLSGDNNLTFANCGVTGGGARVFFQCRGESFDIGGGGDIVTPYALFANGHDSSLSGMLIPMSDRVTCQNQLGRILQGNKSRASFRLRHTGDTDKQIEEIRRLGTAYFSTIKEMRALMEEMRSTAVKTEDLQKFYHEVWQKSFKPIPLNPTDEDQQKIADSAKQGFAMFMKRFETEKPIAGASVWNMANAFTGYIQHDKGNKTPNAARSRWERSMFGDIASKSAAAFRIAVGLCS